MGMYYIISPLCRAHVRTKLVNHPYLVLSNITAPDGCVAYLQAANGFEECVDALLHNGGDPSIRDVRGRTPVHLAAACGHVGLLGSLLQVGDVIKKLVR